MRSFSRPSLLGIALGLSILSGATFAQGVPSTGLGQSWPDSPDVSFSPAYHVFLFERLGTRYVQVNDLAGNVRGAFAYAGDQIVGLPVGVDATRLSTPSEPATVQPVGAGVMVYRDTTVSVSVSPAAQPGTLLLMASDSDCKNPAECGVHRP